MPNMASRVETGLGHGYDASEININNKYLDVGDLTLNSKDTQIADRFPTGTATGFVFRGIWLCSRGQRSKGKGQCQQPAPQIQKREKKTHPYTHGVYVIYVYLIIPVYRRNTEACMGLCYFASDFVLRFVPCQAQPSWICCHYFWQCSSCSFTCPTTPTKTKFFFIFYFCFWVFGNMPGSMERPWHVGDNFAFIMQQFGGLSV